MSSIAKARRFEKFVESAYKRNCAKVDEAFPIKDVSVRKLVLEGKGEFRSCAHLRNVLKERSYLEVSDVFNVDKEIAEINESNKINVSKRSEMRVQLSNEKEKLIKYAYFSTEEELLKMLNEFENMSFE